MNNFYSDKERFEWFVNRVNKMLGMTALLVHEGADMGKYHFSLVYYSPTNIKLGHTTIMLTAWWEGIIFGSNSGMFTTLEVKEQCNKIADEYRKKFNKD